MDNRLSYMPFGNPINFYDPLGYASIPGTIAGLLAIFAGCEPLADLYSKMDKARELAENEWWNMTMNFESSSFNPKCDKSEQAKEKFVKERIKNLIGPSELLNHDLKRLRRNCGIHVVVGILLILKT